MGKRRSKHGSVFLDDDCGQNALQLAARGSALIAEILRLSEHIPMVFREPESAPEYAKIICDFKYFTVQDQFEKAIQDSADLLHKDDEFRLTHFELLERFFKLFRGVYGYAQELNRYIEEIREGMFISQTIESILVDQDGKQLMCEIFYLFGVMLLLLDYRIGGRTREYLIVSYIRYKGAGEQHTVEITSMCRNTGYVKDARLPDQYPVQYFARVPLDRELIGLLIGRIRSDDIYQMSYNYPAPEHRGTALANQAALLYILLFFRPEILLHERPVMREIVDKHFADNWVINYYMGFTVDLVVAWQHFKAAKAAIEGTIAMDTVTYHQARMRGNLSRLNVDLAALLHEGVLTEQFVLDNIHSTILPQVRDANVTLRWFILHMTRGAACRKYFEEYRKSYEHVTHNISDDDVLTLLLQTAQLEFILKAMFERLLKEKRSKWMAAQEQGVSKMEKLATYFSGEHPLSDNVRLAQLEQWFSDIATRIESLDYSDSTTASRKIQKLMKALENVLEFHQIDSNLQVVQFVQDTRFLLRQMIRYINIERKVLITIATVGDLSYAWELLSHFGCFVDGIQMKIKRNPHLAIQMRSAFVKLATMLELPCTRIDQAAANDMFLTATLESVSEYYSSELVVFVRKVLHIVPISIFDVLTKIVALLVQELRECPTKLPRKELKQQSQIELRHRLAGLTSEIAKFANGILAMESTLVGVIQVDPHQLLEDGIRKELTRMITHQLHASLIFDAKRVLTAEEFDVQLQSLGRQLHGFRQAFEYIQDYVNMHGLRIWIEEFSRIVNFNVEMECNAFMQKKLYHWKSKYQSDSIPIPYFERATSKDTYSFLGRIVQHLLAMTDPRKITFLPSLGSWYDMVGGREVVGARTFNSIMGAIGSPGLVALDRLLCFIVAKDLQILIGMFRRAVEPHHDLFATVKKDLTPISGVPLVAGKHYAALDNAMGKVLSDGTDILVRIGRIQLIRAHIANELRSTCKLNSAALFQALATANTALLADLDRHYADPGEHSMPGEIVAALSTFLDSTGMVHPQSKVYVTSKPLPELCFVLVALVIKNCTRVQFDEQLCCLTRKKKDDSFDAVPFAFAVMLLLKQFHSDLRDLFVGHLTQFVRVSLLEYDTALASGKAKNAGAALVPESPITAAHMVELLCVAGNVPLSDLHRTLPPQLLGDTRLQAVVAKKK